MLGVIAVFAAMMVIGPRLYRERYSPERRSMPAYYALMAFCWGPFALVYLLPTALADLLLTLRTVLVYLFMLAGTDWAELIDMSAAWMSRVAGLDTRPRAALITTMILAGTTLLVILRQSPGALAIYSIISWLGVSTMIIIVLWLARFRGNWPLHLPWAGLAVVVLLFNVIGDAVLRWFVGGDFTRIAELTPGVLAYFATAFVITAILLVRLARMGLSSLAPVVLFALISIGEFLLHLPNERNGALPPASGVLFATAAASLGAAALLLRSTVPVQPLKQTARLLFILNAGLLGLYLLWKVVYQAMQQSDEAVVVVAAIVLFVSVAWDILMSGRSITNVDGVLFPRRARVYLFLGYVMLTVATIVFFGSMRGEGLEHDLARLFANTDYFVQIGIAMYGPAMLLALFVLRVGRSLFAEPSEVR
jgi:hypothetical protein